MTVRGMLAGCAACAAAVALAVPAAATAAPPAALDPAFGTDGVAPLTQGQLEGAVDVAATPDGGVVVLGGAAGGADGLVVMKLGAAGSPDPAFGGGDGVAVVRFGEPSDGSPGQIAVDATGRIVVAGVVGRLGEGSSAAFARLRPDGALDPAFDGDGKLLLRFAPAARTSAPSALRVAADGRVTVAGSWRHEDAGDGADHQALVTLDAAGQATVAPRTWRSWEETNVAAVATAADRVALAGDEDQLALLGVRTAALDALPGFPDPLRYDPIAGPSETRATDLVLRPDGSALAVGFTSDLISGVTQGLTISTGPAGLLDHQRIDGPAGRGLSLSALGADREGRLLAGGHSFGAGTDEQPAIVALDGDGRVDAARGGVQPVELPEWILRPDDVQVAFEGSGDAFSLLRFEDEHGVDWDAVARIDVVAAETPGPGPGPVPEPGPGPGPAPGPGPGPQPGQPPRSPQVAPLARFAPIAKGAVRSLSGNVGGGARIVEVALTQVQPGRGRDCRALVRRTPAFGKPRGCSLPAGFMVDATSAGRWTLRFDTTLPAGRYVGWVRALHGANVVARPFSARAGNKVEFTVKPAGGQSKGGKGQSKGGKGKGKGGQSKGGKGQSKGGKGKAEGGKPKAKGGKGKAKGGKPKTQTTPTTDGKQRGR